MEVNCDDDRRRFFDRLSESSESVPPAHAARDDRANGSGPHDYVGTDISDDAIDRAERELSGFEF